MKPINTHFNVIIPIDINPYPDKYEISVARIMANKFKSDILFVPPINSRHTPDLQVVRTGEFWETKNIRGNSKNTIEDNLKKASRQSSNIIISLLRSKMTPSQASVRIRHNLNRAHGTIRKVILITKTGEAIDFHS